MPRLTDERLAELRRTQYNPVEALRQHIDGPGGLRERMDEGNVTAFEADVVMGYDALQDVIDAQADEIERLRRERDNWKRVAEQKTDALCDVAEERARLRTEREVLAEAVLAEQRRIDYVNTHATADETAFTLDQEAHRTWEAALALLDGEKGGDADE